MSWLSSNAQSPMLVTEPGIVTMPAFSGEVPPRYARVVR